MPAPYRTSRRVEFRDTDAAGIVHFSTFFAYMEEVEHELLRHLGISVVMRDAEGVLSWPRVAANCEYRGVARFEDMVEIEVCVQRLGTKSVTYAFRFLMYEKEIAHGKVTAVCCRVRADQAFQPIAIPPSFAEKLARHLCDG